MMTKDYKLQDIETLRIARATAQQRLAEISLVDYFGIKDLLEYIKEYAWNYSDVCRDLAKEQGYIDIEDVENNEDIELLETFDEVYNLCNYMEYMEELIEQAFDTCKKLEYCQVD
jgi:hypothetical protein